MQKKGLKLTSECMKPAIPEAIDSRYDGRSYTLMLDDNQVDAAVKEYVRRRVNGTFSFVGATPKIRGDHEGDCALDGYTVVIK